MKWFAFFVLLLWLLPTPLLRAESTDLWDDRAWALVAFPRDAFPAQALHEIEHMIEGGTRDLIHVHVLNRDLEKIEGWDTAHNVVAQDVRELRPQRFQKDIGGGYHTPETAREAIYSMMDQYPDLVRLSVVGYSVEGLPIDAIVISDNVSMREPGEPGLRLVAAYHGDEWASSELALATAWALLGRYDTDANLAQMVDDYEFWIIPMLNPDGVKNFERRNQRGVDLNRNFSWEFERTPQSGTHAFSEPETLALYDLSMTHAFHHNLSVHSGAVNLGWVWNYQTDPSEDDVWFREVAQQYLDTTTASDFWITNGGQWYVVNGESTDWLYGVRGGHDYTLEVSVEKAPPAETIPDVVEEHLESVLGFYQKPGIRGRITTEDGQGLEASVLVEGVGAAMLSDPMSGAFYRPVGPGVYNISISAPGFETVYEAVDVPLEGVLNWNAALSASSELRVARFGELVVYSDSNSLGFIESAEIVQLLLSGGHLKLHRQGAGEPYELAYSIDGERIEFELGHLQFSQREQRGYWDLLITDVSESVVRSFPLAVFVSDTAWEIVDPSDSLTLVEAERGAYYLRGPAQEPGTEVSFLGPGLALKYPFGRMVEEPGKYGFVLEPEDWQDGDWYLRITQAGRYEASQWVLSKSLGQLSLNKIQCADDSQPDDISVAPGSGCTCQANEPLWYLLLLAGLLHIIHRRKKLNLFNEAR